MNELQRVFSYSGVQVRTVIKDGEPWFVAKDVCEILEIKNHNDALNRLSESSKGVASTDTLGGIQETAVVNEPGLYKLIFTSRKAEAEQFQDWVYNEVLPSIRKTGSYGYSLDARIQTIINLGTDAKDKKQLIRKIINDYKQAKLDEITVLQIEKTDHILAFIDECCEFDPDSIIERTELYRIYVCWCVRCGEQPYGKLVFTRKIESFSDAECLPSDYKHGFNSRFTGITAQ